MLLRRRFSGRGDVQGDGDGDGWTIGATTGGGGEEEEGELDRLRLWKVGVKGRPGASSTEPKE